MKISICGKGGSGKSTITALLANAFKVRGYHVLVVDSDESNSGLHRMLGFDQPPLPLMELVGGKKGIKEKMSVKFSSGESEPKMQVLSQEKILVKDIPSGYIQKKDGLRLVTIGKILQSLEGCACPMGVLSREFLAKLKLDRDEVAIIDMEAGIEHFGRGIETSVDNVLVIVEPSFESLELAAKVRALATSSGSNRFWAIINKINSNDIAARIEEQLNKREVNVLGVVHYAKEIFEAGLEGHSIAAGKMEIEVKPLIDTLLMNT